MTKRLLRVSPDLALPAAEAQTGTLIVYGGKGMGKTNFAAVMAEEFAKQSLRFSWIDPVGVAWGLKHAADGKGKGVEVLVLGGVHGDLPIEPTAGAVIADLVVDEDVAEIIDISRRADGRMWSHGEKIRFVRDYCIRLFERQGERRRPLMQMIDECGRFAPQQPPKGAVDIMECLGAIEQLAELGRNVGVGVGLITQRSARMNKSVSELADMMVAFRTVGPRSIDAIMDWFGEHIPKVRQRELIERIRELDVGTAMIVSPGWLKIEGEYKIRARETFDSSATPVAGKERRPTGKGAVVDVPKYREAIAATVERAEADDPKALRKQVAELRKQLKVVPSEPRTKVQEVVKEVEVEVPIIEEATMTKLREETKAIREAARELAKASESNAAIAKQLTAATDSLARVADALERAVEAAREQRTEARAARDRVLARVGAQPRRPVSGPVKEPRVSPDGFQPSASQQRILDALAWLETVGVPQAQKVQLALLADQSPKSSGYTNNLGALRSAGLIAYPGPNLVTLTDVGQATADAPAVPPTTDDLHATLFARLGGSKARILQVLIEAYPEPLEKVDVAEKAGQSPTSSGYTNNLGALRSLKLIDYPSPGWVVAEPALFLEDR